MSHGRVKNVLSSTISRPALGLTQAEGSFLGVKWPGRETDHSPSTSAQVKKKWIYISTPHMPSWHSA
jgi:hypothetical protein